MSWVKINRTNRPKRVPQDPECLARIVLFAKGPRLKLSIKATQEWLVVGRNVDVEAGEGEHVGSVRITPGDTFSVGSAQSNATRKCPVVFFPAPTWLLARSLGSAPCEVVSGPDALVVRLPPDWLQPPALVAKQAAQATLPVLPVSASAVPARAVVPKVGGYRMGGDTAALAEDRRQAHLARIGRKSADADF